jgi:hypothetical protein
MESHRLAQLKSRCLGIRPVALVPEFAGEPEKEDSVFRRTLQVIMLPGYLFVIDYFRISTTGGVRPHRGGNMNTAGGSEGGNGISMPRGSALNGSRQKNERPGQILVRRRCYMLSHKIPGGGPFGI